MAEPHAQTSATVEHAAGGEAHAEPNFLGVTAPMFIALAMLAVIGLMLWKKVPAAIAGALDKKIALIRDQLAEAESLRQEAEGIKAEYEAKSKAAGKESTIMIERAKHEAEAILAKARTDAEALIERRTRMAEEKIAAEERTALEQLRAVAADAATKAAAKLIAEQHDATSDAKLVDRAIKEIAGR